MFKKRVQLERRASLRKPKCQVCDDPNSTAVQRSRCRDTTKCRVPEKVAGRKKMDAEEKKRRRNLR